MVSQNLQLAMPINLDDNPSNYVGVAWCYSRSSSGEILTSYSSHTVTPSFSNLSPNNLLDKVWTGVIYSIIIIQRTSGVDIFCIVTLIWSRNPSLNTILTTVHSDGTPFYPSTLVTCVGKILVAQGSGKQEYRRLQLGAFSCLCPDQEVLEARYSRGQTSQCFSDAINRIARTTVSQRPTGLRDFQITASLLSRGLLVLGEATRPMFSM
jgi:hypothetical protein